MPTTSASKPTSGIGGSILPSSDPMILKPLVGKHGTFVVRPLPEIDTYSLEFTSSDGKYKPTVALHPNGYSCRSLAERIVEAWEGKRNVAYAMEQFDYILSCGGLGLARGSAEFIAKGMPTD